MIRIVTYRAGELASVDEYRFSDKPGTKTMQRPKLVQSELDTPIPSK